MTFWGISEDFLGTFKNLTEDFLRTFLRHSWNFLKSFLGLTDCQTTGLVLPITEKYNWILKLNYQEFGNHCFALFSTVSILPQTTQDCLRLLNNTFSTDGPFLTGLSLAPDFLRKLHSRIDFLYYVASVFVPFLFIFKCNKKTKIAHHFNVVFFALKSSVELVLFRNLVLGKYHLLVLCPQIYLQGMYDILAGKCAQFGRGQGAHWVLVFSYCGRKVQYWPNYIE